ncbi:MAG: hypothetical protein FWB96_03930 [Defluviitaleaceae bacterium]|nr:hypothetical protein [Defluviitaleaceae bacterium]MCL2262062.1 hypothetical protein [Defluviitaleaceae bacterium]
MASKKGKPLGIIKLESKDMAIFPMNDVFLNFTFEMMEHWEALRMAVNLLIEAFKQVMPDARLYLIEGEIEVRTQFKHYLANEDGDVTTRDQDIRMLELDVSTTYVEFQNKANPTVPIKTRSVEYFGLGIGHGKGMVANQIWLLAEDVKELLHGETFTRYILKDEVTGKDHPENSGIMYVSLTKLAQGNTPVGELASFLLGINPDPQNEVVKKIADAFNASFKKFKESKDVVKVLTLRERVKDEIWGDAVAEGKAERDVEISNKFTKLKEKGLDPLAIMQEMELMFSTVQVAKPSQK